MGSIFHAGMTLDDKVELIRLIDTGGQAEVWSVRDINFPGRSELALKIHYAAWEERHDPHFQRRSERLEQEYRIIGRIQHRFIVSPHFRIAGPHMIDGQKFYLSGLVMDLASEGSLHDLILSPAYRKLSNRDKLIFLRRLADGLEAVHSFQIVHNDIKPKNILVTRETNQVIPRFSDFGISFKHGESPVIGGTPPYMAPEVLMRNSSPSFLSDIFSMGIMFYEFVMGRHPLHKLMENEKDLMQFFTGYYDTHEFIDLSEANLFESPTLTELIKRMCSRNPDLRPSIVEIRRSIDQIEIDLASTFVERIEDIVPALVNKFKWNSTIHELFDEKEYFFFITGSRPDQDSLWLSSQISQKRMFGYSIFRLVGSNDCLLRIWLRQSSLYYLTRILEDYQRQRFGTFRLLSPDFRLPAISLRDAGKPLNATAAARAISALITDAGTLDDVLVKKYERQKIIVGRTKSSREGRTSEFRRNIRVILLVTTKGAVNEKFSRLIAQDIYDKIGGVKGASEVEVFSYHGKNGSPGEFLLLCEIENFHQYKHVFDLLEKSLTEINADLVSQFRTHFELDAQSPIESYDGCLIHEVSLSRPR